MKHRNLYLSLLIVCLIFGSCGPRRYKCGPYRKCENSIKNIDKTYYYKEFHKSVVC